MRTFFLLLMAGLLVSVTACSNSVQSDPQDTDLGDTTDDQDNTMTRAFDLADALAIGCYIEREGRRFDYDSESAFFINNDTEVFAQVNLATCGAPVTRDLRRLDYYAVSDVVEGAQPRDINADSIGIMVKAVRTRLQEVVQKQDRECRSTEPAIEIDVVRSQNTIDDMQIELVCAKPE